MREYQGYNGIVEMGMMKFSDLSFFISLFTIYNLQFEVKPRTCLLIPSKKP